MNSIKNNIQSKVLYEWSVKYTNILRSKALIILEKKYPFALVNEALFDGLNDKQNEEI